VKIRDEIQFLSRFAGVTGVTADSRNAGPGTAFVAIVGAKADGNTFIPEVLSRGCPLVVTEQPPKGLVDDSRIVQVANARQVLSLLAARFAGDPTASMRVVGVTGTSGKTTTTWLLDSIFRAAGKKCGLIGTISVRFDSPTGWVERPAALTTPDLVELQRLFAEMRGAGVEIVVMEVSSHALHQHRVDGTLFDGMLFTNLTAEHLDYHPGMEEYFAAKRMLFTDHASAARAGGKTPVFVVNARDPYGKKLLAEVKGAVDFAGDAAGFKTNLLGAFHLENVAGAVAMARQLGIPDSAIRQGLRELAGVPGRLERVKPGHPFEVIVDYAHKIDALEKVLDVLRPVTRGRILTVFGCGGDRDREKRPVMGRVACEKSGHVWVTSDNPRSEDPMAIISENASVMYACRSKAESSSADRLATVLTSMT
jgi:UDP-N-acetylmuramyl tripeptide synthase